MGMGHLILLSLHTQEEWWQASGLGFLKAGAVFAKNVFVFFSLSVTRTHRMCMCVYVCVCASVCQSLRTGMGMNSLSKCHRM